MLPIARRPKAITVVALLAAVIVFSGSLPGGPRLAPAGAQEPEVLPIIFVHGFVGSGAQYQTQAMRFASNGYPADHVRVFDYNSLDAAPDVVQPLLDDYIDAVLAELGATQAHMVGHSLGTRVMQDYLNSSPERAARVAKYINIDGFPADALPGAVPTLAIWGMGNDDEAVLGGTNVYLTDQTHVQVVSSPESFAAQYEFLLGDPPASTDVVPQQNVEIAGRAVDFPVNAGWDGATLEIWEVDGATGMRTSGSPAASYVLPADGSWGPLAAQNTQHYEMVLVREGAANHHIYFQPFTRSNYLVRLLSVAPSSPIAQNIEASDRHTTVTVIRYKEWWGDDPGGNNDTLEINGVNVISPATSPVSHRSIGIHNFDRRSDGVTDLSAPDPFFFALPFQTGVDIFMPASAPPDGSICFANAPRGDDSRMQVVNVPNWRSTEDRISIEFTDYVREGEPECAVAAAPAAPTPASTAAPAGLPQSGGGTPAAGTPVALVAGLFAAGAALIAGAGWYARRRRA